MREVSATTKFNIYTRGELPEGVKELLAEAESQTKNAYAPYSHFPVGAALRLESGKMLGANNQENSAYPSGLCAERNLLFFTGSNYPKENVIHLAVAVTDITDKTPYPCGACLQVIAETQFRQNSPINIYLIHPVLDEIWHCIGVQNLLPYAFSRTHLGVWGK